MKRQLIYFSTILNFFVILPSSANDQDDSKSKPASTDYTVGKLTQTVTPREMKETVRPDGKTSIITGQTRTESGKIVGPHSHSVINNGSVEYSRTAGGRVVGNGEGPGGGAGVSGSRMPPSGGGGMRNDSK